MAKKTKPMSHAAGVRYRNSGVFTSGEFTAKLAAGLISPPPKVKARDKWGEARPHLGNILAQIDKLNAAEHPEFKKAGLKDVYLAGHKITPRKPTTKK